MIHPIPTVFVFTCGPDYYGFSTQADGANLPALAQCSHQWLAFKTVAMTESDLAPLVRDAKHALSNLKVRGFFLVRATAEVVEFPRSHRYSA